MREERERAGIAAAGWCRDSRNARGLFNPGKSHFSSLLCWPPEVLHIPTAFPYTELPGVRKFERMGRLRKVAPYISINVEPEMKANPQDAE